MKVDTAGVTEVGDSGCPSERVVTAVAEGAGEAAVVADASVDAGADVASADVAGAAGADGLMVTPAAAQY